MSERLRLSIALATYNGAQYLREQLDSLAAQSRLPDELVVCDDGSTDETLDVLEGFAATAPFEVRIVRNPSNLGYMRNFSKAAALCRGDVIFFCDQDDLWHPGKLARVAEIFESDPGLMVVLNDARLVDEALRWSGKTQYGNVRQAGLPDYYFLTGCCSAHRSVWQSVALPVPAWVGAHDLWVNRFAQESGCATILGEALQDYRRHGGNSSQWLLSDQSGASPLGLWKAHGLNQADEGWRFAERMLAEMQRRLENLDLCRSQLPLPLVERAIARIRRHRRALTGRIAVCERPRFRRPPHLVRLWGTGGYGHFQGWKSALKDLIRP